MKNTNLSGDTTMLNHLELNEHERLNNYLNVRSRDFAFDGALLIEEREFDEAELNFFGICLGGKGCEARTAARKEKKAKKKALKQAGKEADVALTQAAVAAATQADAAAQEKLSTGTVVAVAAVSIVLLVGIGWVIVRRNKAIAAAAAAGVAKKAVVPPVKPVVKAVIPPTPKAIAA
jgi:hypothetical protein